MFDVRRESLVELSRVLVREVDDVVLAVNGELDGGGSGLTHRCHR